MKGAMYDLDPGVMNRTGGRSPIRLPDLDNRRRWAELAVTWECLRRALADTDDHPAIFELMHHFPLGDIIRALHAHLPIMTDPRFQALFAERSLPALDNLSAARLARDLPEGTLGHTYGRFIEELELGDAFLDYLPRPDEAVAYLAWRTVLLHDLMHLLLDYRPGNRLHEVQVEAFLFAQTGALNHLLFMIGYGINFTHTAPRLAARLPGAVASAFLRGRRAERLLLVRWQELLETPIDVVRQRCGLQPRPTGAPDLEHAPAPG